MCVAKELEREGALPIGPGRSAFPSTHWSVLKPPQEGPADSEARRRSLEALARLYWRPVYAHFRSRWRQSPEQAEDMTQDFFLWVLERSFMERAQPGYGRFRNFVKTHLDNFMRNRLRAGRRLCRGGDKRILSIDRVMDAGAFPAGRSKVPVEEVLDHHWKRAILERALERLESAFTEEGKPLLFEVLKRYDLAGSEGERPTYVDLAGQLKIAPSDVENALVKARKGLYQCIREIVAESVDSPEGLREEMEFLFPGRSR